LNSCAWRTLPPAAWNPATRSSATRSTSRSRPTSGGNPPPLRAALAARIEVRQMTLGGLAARLGAADGVGEPDYADDGMLQYLGRAHRRSYQTRGCKVVEMVRIYEVGRRGGRRTERAIPLCQEGAASRDQLHALQRKLTRRAGVLARSSVLPSSRATTRTPRDRQLRLPAGQVHHRAACRAPVVHARHDRGRQPVLRDRIGFAIARDGHIRSAYSVAPPCSRGSRPKSSPPRASCLQAVQRGMYAKVAASLL